MAKEVPKSKDYDRERKENKRLIKFFLTLTSAAKAGLPFSTVYTLSMATLFTPGMPPHVKEAVKEIYTYFKKDNGITITKAEVFDSIEQLPSEVGEYKVTEEIKKDISDFLKKSEKNYLVKAGEEDIYAVRMNKRGNAVQNVRNVFNLLDKLYDSFCKRSTKANSLLEETLSEIDNKIIFCKDITIDEKKRYAAKVGETGELLRDAKQALETIGNSTSVYLPHKFIVQEGLDNLEKMIRHQKHIKKRINKIQAKKYEVMADSFEGRYSIWNRSRY